MGEKYEYDEECPAPRKPWAKGDRVKVFSKDSKGYFLPTIYIVERGADEKGMVIVRTEDKEDTLDCGVLHRVYVVKTDYLREADYPMAEAGRLYVDFAGKKFYMAGNLDPHFLFEVNTDPTSRFFSIVTPNSVRYDPTKHVIWFRK